MTPEEREELTYLRNAVTSLASAMDQVFTHLSEIDLALVKLVQLHSQALGADEHTHNTSPTPPESSSAQ
jgi:hypothetical protein